MNAAAGIVEVRVPDMGNFKDVAIIDVLVKPGEKIEPEASLVTLETEKATMDVPSTVGGIVDKVHVSKGGTVSPGDLIVTVRSEGSAASEPTAESKKPEKAPEPSPAVEKKAEKPAAAPKQAAPKAAEAPAKSTPAPQVNGSPGEAAPTSIAGGTGLPPINEPGFSRAHAGP